MVKVRIWTCNLLSRIRSLIWGKNWKLNKIWIKKLLKIHLRRDIQILTSIFNTQWGNIKNFLMTHCRGKLILNLWLLKWTWPNRRKIIFLNCIIMHHKVKFMAQIYSSIASISIFVKRRQMGFRLDLCSQRWLAFRFWYWIFSLKIKLLKIFLS